MTLINKIKRTLLPITLILALVSPVSSRIVTAKEAATKAKMEKVFIPFRDQIPFYISKNSSSKEQLIKELWLKLFYEELNWDENHRGFYDKKFDSWWKKYKGTPYAGLDGEFKDIDRQLTFSSGDFEAFLGNTLEANPEFLGQLLGLDGYTPPPQPADNPTFSRQVICQYLADSDKYAMYLTPSLIKLTQEGEYLSDNSLKTISFKDVPVDYYMLAIIASQYHQTDKYGKDILSSKQIDWLNGYIKEMYEAYTTDSSALLKSLVVKYPSLYDLVARSYYAANDSTEYGQEFFDYVVASGVGMGAWLSLNDDIDIKGLDQIPDLISLFKLSNGFCGGLEDETKCKNRDKCLAAVSADYVATGLHKNETARGYILANESTAEVYGTDEHKGWQNKYRLMHKKLIDGLDTIDVIAGESKDDPKHDNAHFNGWTGVFKEITSHGSGTVDSRAFMPNTKKITVYAYYLGPDRRDYQGFNWVVKSKGINISGKVKMDKEWVNAGTTTCRSGDKRGSAKANLKAFTFDISRLNEEDIKDIKIFISLRQHNEVLGNGSGDYGHVHDHPIDSNCGILEKVTCHNTIDDCEDNGDDWKGTLTVSEETLEGTIDYFCTKNREHHYSEPIKATITEENDDYTVYTAKGTYGTYSKRILKSSESEGNSKTITLDSTNTSGKLSNTIRSNERIYPGGSLSSETYKAASASINCTILPGVIKTGAKIISLKCLASQELADLSIKVYSSRKVLLVENNLLSSSTIYNLDLSYLTDDEIKDCFVEISAQAKSKNKERYHANVGGPEPAEAVATISVKSVTIQY
jgi:hypothetical protein